MDIPETFTLLPIPLPPMLAQYANIHEAERFVAFYYACTNPTWTDGRRLGTFSFYGIWDPWINHLAMAIHLFDADLGHDDSEPTHYLVADLHECKVWVAPREGAEQFLAAQCPPRQLTPAEAAEERQALLAFLEAEDNLISLESCQAQGLFEFFGASPENQQRKAALNLWLDDYITVELVKQYLTAAGGGNPLAISYLHRFRQRLAISAELN
ncbi:MAG: hypothetical protein WCA35_21110 [Kovacikia sp.]